MLVNADENLERKECFYTVGGNVNTTLIEIIMEVPHKVVNI